MQNDKKMNYRPWKIPKEGRIEEALILRQALKAKGMTQIQLGDMLNLSQANISQWFKTDSPVQIPDWAWVACAAELKFNPLKHRAYLQGLKDNLNRALQTEDQVVNERAMLLDAFRLMNQSDQLRLLGRLEGMLEQK